MCLAAAISHDRTLLTIASLTEVQPIARKLAPEPALVSGAVTVAVLLVSLSLLCSARGELVTPTGAALVRVLASDYGRPPLFVPQTIGENLARVVWLPNGVAREEGPLVADMPHYSPVVEAGIGAGTKNFDKHPNILRVILGDVAAPPAALEPSPLAELAAPAAGAEGGDWSTRQLWILEANIDDMTGEAAGYLTEKLLEEGCLDAWISPIVMKKSRPGFTVHVLCDPQDQERFMRLLFVDSTTIGVRRRSVERCALRRTTATVGTSFGDVRVKVGDAHDWIAREIL